MILSALNVILADVAAAPAAAPGTQPNPTAQMLQPIGLFVLMIAIFYFVILGPQRKKQKEHAAMLETLKPGDKVVTSGGVVGIVVSVKDRTISMRSAETKLEILKSAISEVTRGESSSAES